MRRIMVILFCVITGLSALCATYKVGPTRQHKTLQEVAELLNPGDVVEVDGGTTYPGDVVFSRPGAAGNPITVRGLRVGGARPILSGGTNTVTFKTEWPYSGPGADHYVFEGFEVTGGSFRGIFHQADDLVIRDVYVHDCPAHGILGADEGSGSCAMEQCEVARCGQGDGRHQIYMATDEVNHPGSVFRMRFCYIHDGNGGNNVKSRAERNEIYYNWIEGAYYHELELIGPDGGDGGNPSLKREDSDVVGNVLWKRATAASNDPNFSVTRIGGDGTGETNGRYRFANNTIVCGTGSVFRCFDGLESVEMHSNVIFNPTGSPTVMRTVDANWSAGHEVIGGSNNWVKSGASNTPSQWTRTLSGDSPGFKDFGAFDLCPAAGSPLLDAGALSPQSPPGFDFPSPLFPPASEPPTRGASPVSPRQRAISGAIDIGAYELVKGTDPPWIIDFHAIPGQVFLGQPCMLSWIVMDATSFKLDPGELDVSGSWSLEVLPAATTIYTLTASGPGGAASAEVTVKVVPAWFTCADDDNKTGIEDGTALHPFSSVEAAATSTPAGTPVFVAAGSYKENISIENRAVMLYGGYKGGTAEGYASGVPGLFEGPAVPFTSQILGDGTQPVLHFRRTSPVEGFTVINGFRIAGGTRGILLDPEYPSGDFKLFQIEYNLIEENGAHNLDFKHGGGGIFARGEEIYLQGNIIRANRADFGAGVLGGGKGWVAEGNRIEGNEGYGDHGGGLWLVQEAALRENMIRGNRVGTLAGYGWGGGLLMAEGDFMMYGDTISENEAPTLGGGIFVDEGATARIDRCLVVKNRTLVEWVKGGAGIYVDASWDGRQSAAYIENCTVAENSSPGTNGGNGIFLQGSNASASNSIFWGNGDDFYVDPSSPASLTVSYTLSQEPWEGEGNFSSDPLFADPAKGNFRLKSKTGRYDDAISSWVVDTEHSPAIDAGDPIMPPMSEPDPNGGRVNLGFDGGTSYASKSVISGCSLSCEAGTLADAPVLCHVPFSASATQTGCSGPVAYEWDFGDGSPRSSERNPEHVYQTVGTFDWTMTSCSGNSTCVKRGSIRIFLTECYISYIVTVVPSEGPAPLEVTFHGQEQPSNLCGRNVYTWDFGDGTTAAGSVVTHVYAWPGSYEWTFVAQPEGNQSPCYIYSKSGTILVLGGAVIPGDCDVDGTVSIGELQRVINMFLGLAPPACNADCNGDGIISIGEVQKVINAFLGLQSSC